MKRDPRSSGGRARPVPTATQGAARAPLVREAEPRDAAALARLIGQLGYEAGEDEVLARLPLLDEPGRCVLVAELDGRVAGCLTTSMMHVLHRPAAVGRISMMVVEAGLRGQGIGAVLVRAAEDHLVAAGCYMVEVTSNLARADAHRFYERLDYERTSIRLAREVRPGTA